MTPNGREIDSPDPTGFAARAIRAGLTVAIKGLGGFHLACDATAPLSVQRLRERKHREVKPLAVMVRDLAAASELAFISDEEARLLTSVERPIVLLRKKLDAKLAPEVTGDNPLVGLFLPYTPMHHLLLRDVAVPLVMTSGNLAEEPMVHRDADAFAQLASVADLFITHNRAIESRIDDSVVRVIDAAPVVFRRARGWVPRGIDVVRTFAEPVLACGAHLKNTVCIGAGNAAFLGPHIGDLETVETLTAYETAIIKMKNFVGAEPKLLAHDLHPDYFSTRYALAQDGVRTVGVQHHHAHVAAAMAEHRLDGDVVGIAYDGTGYGTDGTAWGGEVLIASFEGFERFATFRPIPLAGGDQAIRQVWRIALALLDEAFDGAPPLHALPLFAPIPRRGVDAQRLRDAMGSAPAVYVTRG
jgi:hydrogenase maturation protein HypF